jgi:hypothetical protein
MPMPFMQDLQRCRRRPCMASGGPRQATASAAELKPVAYRCATPVSVAAFKNSRSTLTIRYHSVPSAAVQGYVLCQCVTHRWIRMKPVGVRIRTSMGSMCVSERTVRKALIASEFTSYTITGGCPSRWRGAASASYDGLTATPANNCVSVALCYVLVVCAGRGSAGGAREWPHYTPLRSFFSVCVTT